MAWARAQRDEKLAGAETAQGDIGSGTICLMGSCCVNTAVFGRRLGSVRHRVPMHSKQLNLPAQRTGYAARTKQCAGFS